MPYCFLLSFFKHSLVTHFKYVLMLAPLNRLKPSSKIVLLTVPRRYFLCGSFVFFVLVFLILSRLFIAALWSPSRKGLTSCLLLVSCWWCLLYFCYFPMWYLIVSFSDLCRPSYFLSLRSLSVYKDISCYLNNMKLFLEAHYVVR